MHTELKHTPSLRKEVARETRSCIGSHTPWVHYHSTINGEGLIRAHSSLRSTGQLMVARGGPVILLSGEAIVTLS